MSAPTSLLQDVEPRSRQAIYAVLVCLSATLVGALLARIIATTTTAGYLPVGVTAIAVYVLLGASWVSLDRRPAFDPAATFVVYLSCVVTCLWMVRFFFIDAAIGPFAEQWWTAQNLLGNAIFGTASFMLLGATVGTTYVVARRTAAAVNWRRTLIYAVAVGLPIVFLARAEYLLTTLMS